MLSRLGVKGFTGHLCDHPSSILSGSVVFSSITKSIEHIRDKSFISIGMMGPQTCNGSILLSYCSIYLGNARRHNTVGKMLGG